MGEPGCTHAQHHAHRPAHQAASHQGGWETFTDRVIGLVGAKTEHVVFVLWGAHARKKKALVDQRRHTILESPHPSPLSAHRGFFGSRPFSAVNAALENADQPPLIGGSTQPRETVPEFTLLFCGDGVPLSRLETLQCDRPDRDADETQGRVPDCCGHSTYLAILAFGERETNPGIRNRLANADRYWSGRERRFCSEELRGG